jgi:hypothetical protein
MTARRTSSARRVSEVLWAELSDKEPRPYGRVPRPGHVQSDDKATCVGWPMVGMGAPVLECQSSAQCLQGLSKVPCSPEGKQPIAGGRAPRPPPERTAMELNPERGSSRAVPFGPAGFSRNEPRGRQRTQGREGKRPLLRPSWNPIRGPKHACRVTGGVRCARPPAIGSNPSGIPGQSAFSRID